MRRRPPRPHRRANGAPRSPARHRPCPHPCSLIHPRRGNSASARSATATINAKYVLAADFAQENLSRRVASRGPSLISPRSSKRAGSVGICDMLNIVSSKARGEASMSAKNGSIKLVAGNSNPALAQEIADWLHLPPTKAIVRRFADMEIFVEIQENVRGSDVFIIQSTSFPANDHLMELLIITDALRRASARRITAVVPYFGYA